MLAIQPQFQAMPTRSHVHHDRDQAGDEVKAFASGSIGQCYARFGGVIGVEDMSLLIRRHCDQPVSQLARWIVDARIVHFATAGQTWIPLFQFCAEDMSIKPTVLAVLAELAPTMNSDEVAAWFATPKDSLSGKSPLEAIEGDFSAVLGTARADRFILGM